MSRFPRAAVTTVAALVLIGTITTAAASKSRPVAYCSDLLAIVALATTKDRFASITGKPRDGNYFDTSVSLTGWNNCALYGTRTYTCDSQIVQTAKKAERLQMYILQQVKTCLGNTWAEIKDRSSSRYVVLHPTAGATSITLSVDEIEKNKHIVHLILFLRGG